MSQPTDEQLQRLAAAIRITIEDEPTAPDDDRERLRRSGVLTLDGSFEPFGEPAAQPCLNRRWPRGR